MLIEPALTGERTYAHGADIFDAVVACTGACDEMVLVLRAASDCAIAVLDGAVPHAVQDCGTFRHHIDGEVRRHVLRRMPERPIHTRIAVDDAALAAGAVLVGDRAELPAESGGRASFLMRATALCLVLLERDHPDDYWTLVEIACRHRPPAAAGIGIVLASRVGGRFRKATLAAGGDRVGHLVLARGQPRR